MPVGDFTLAGGILTPPLSPANLAVSSAPNIDPAYGVDVSCLVDVGDGQGLDPLFRLQSGPVVVAEAVIRRWVSAPGDLEQDPDSGANLLDYVNDDLDFSSAAQLSKILENEARRDERVAVCTVTVSLDEARKLAIRGQLTPYRGRPFSIVFDPALLSLTVLQGLVQ